MTRRRWIADELSGNRAALTGEHAAHLVRVLRARVGQEFDIVADSAIDSPASSKVRRGRVTSIADGRVEFDLGEEVPDAVRVDITLALAVFKFDRMEWAIEKCTELGVSRIVPVIARRTDAHLAAASVARADRWRRICRQAAEQSRRVALPEIPAPMKLSQALSLAEGLRVVLTESESQTRLRDVLDSATGRSEIALAIGPEGGWTEDELQMFQQSGWISASLGGTILRAETAAIAATAVVASLLG
jgi:16S rRNA (uracil1498-N3)-methyltransferase